MNRIKRLPFTLVITTIIGLLAGVPARADSIPSNPFKSRMLGLAPNIPAIASAPVFEDENSASTVDFDLEVVGIVSSADITIITLKQGDDRLFSVASGELVDDILKFVEIDNDYASFANTQDGTIWKLKLPGDGRD